MSRGHGRTQLAILAALRSGERLSTVELMDSVYNIGLDADGYVTYSSAQHAAVRRALGTLQRDGYIVRVGQHRSALWMTAAAAEAHARRRLDLLLSEIRAVRDNPDDREAVRRLGLRGTVDALMLSGFSEAELAAPGAEAAILDLLRTG